MLSLALEAVGDAFLKEKDIHKRFLVDDLLWCDL